MNNQKGIVHLALILVVLLILGGAVGFFLISKGVIKNPFQNLPFFGQKGPAVNIKTEYENPFKKETQYVNPFDEYKNPFTVNR